MSSKKSNHMERTKNFKNLMNISPYFDANKRLAVLKKLCGYDSLLATTLSKGFGLNRSDKLSILISAMWYVCLVIKLSFLLERLSFIVHTDNIRFIILSLCYCGIEVWGSALQNKYLQRIDKFFRRTYKFGYTLKEYKISHLVEEREKSLFAKIVNDSGHTLPEKKSRFLRERQHSFYLTKDKN